MISGMRNTPGGRGSGSLDAIDDRGRPRDARSSNVALFFQHVQGGPPVAIKGQTVKQSVLIGRKHITRLSTPRAAHIGGFSVEAFCGDDDMAGRAALRLVARHHVAVGELAER